MNRFEVFKRLAWSVIVVCAVSLGMSGCEGDDGRDGDDGAAGTAGAPGADGQSCWDLNGNGVGDLPGEDVNGDGVVDVNDCQPGADPIAAAVAEAQIESCGTCHDAVGDGHQAVYNQYADTETLVMTFTSLDVQPNLVIGGFDLTLDFSIAQNGIPYTLPLSTFDTTAFYVVEYDSGTGEFYNSVGGFAFGLSANNAVSNGDGTFTLTQNVAADPTAFGGGAIVGRIASGRLDIEERQAGKRISMYADYASASWPIGDYVAFEPAANVGACENCHGAPYRKHGTYPGMIADGNTPGFSMCRGCHNNTANGGHPEWQHMVDDPLAWANGQAPTAAQSARYGYERTLQQDVHMSHALEFPYPQSMANCATCHGELYDDLGAPIPGTDKLAQVLDNSNFQMETCQGCHVIEGVDAWPDDLTGTGDAGPYYQSHRAPAFGYLWRRGSDLTFHETLAPGTNCTGCHGGFAPAFSEYHNGYDPRISNGNGERYADLFDASIDSVAVAGDLITIGFSADASGIANAVAGTTDIHVYVSFYGWDTKHFIVPSHTRDTSNACSGGSRGCRYETSTLGFSDDPTNSAYNPLFPSLTETAPGTWELTVDMAAWIGGQPDSIPNLIASGAIKRGEVTLASRLRVTGLHGDVAAALSGVTRTFDIASGALVADYFKGTQAVVNMDKCNACHDQLAVTFHAGSGRGGEGTGDMLPCKNCHNPTYTGGHLEMQSRSIESYVHGIHSFQDFDLEGGRDPGIFDTFDPVLAKRYDMHIEHAFPYFTAQACEACHEPGTYNVPDQSMSIPGVLSESSDLGTWYSIVPGAAQGLTAAVEDPTGRNIGFVPEYVVGPASRACGACHRAGWINEDDAGSLASFNAHTDAFGTLVKNDTADDEGTPLDDEILFGIIDWILTLFE